MKLYSLLTVLLAIVFTGLSAQQIKLTLPSIQNPQQSSAFEPINLTGDSAVIGYLKINPESNEREAVVIPTEKRQWLQYPDTANLEGLSAAQSPAKPSRFYTRDEMIQAETDRYAFIRRSANPTGIYMSYEEFKTGKPAFEHFYLKREAESTQKKEIKLPDEK